MASLVYGTTSSEWQRKTLKNYRGEGWLAICQVGVFKWVTNTKGLSEQGCVIVGRLRL